MNPRTTNDPKIRSLYHHLTRRLSKILLRSSSSLSLPSATTSFTPKYQLPSEDLDSLIFVTTDEGLENGYGCFCFRRNLNRFLRSDPCWKTVRNRRIGF
ncbi:hypothetical protein HanIR_Chr01g0008981 [Helianthus annuus]|nr:hypothetical protein HanIR_Chr01g0008981 [Helianthus annuus]